MGRDDRAVARSHRISTRSGVGSQRGARDGLVEDPSSDDMDMVASIQYISSADEKSKDFSGEIIAQAVDEIDIEKDIDQDEVHRRVEANIKAGATQAQVFDDSQENRFCTYFVAASVVLALVIAGVTVGVVMAGRGGKNPPLTPSPTMSPVAFDQNLSQDSCASAINLSDLQVSSSELSVVGTTMEATSDTGVASCGDVVTNGNGVWYYLESDKDIVYSVDTCTATNFDTQVSIFQVSNQGDSCNSLQCLEANDQRFTCGQDASQLFFKAEKGGVYFVLVHGARRSAGVFSMLITEKRIINSNCDDAEEIVDTDPGSLVAYSVFGTTKFSSLENQETLLCGGKAFGAPPAWFRFTAESSRFLEAKVDDFQARISIFEDSCLDLKCNVSNQVGSALWTTKSGVTYYIAVHGIGGEGNVGDFVLTILPGGLLRPDSAAPSNTVCTASAEVSMDSLPITFNASTVSGQIFLAPPCGLDVQNSAKGLWYSLLGNGKRVRASTCDTTSGFDTQISVYRGPCTQLDCVDGADQSCGDQSAVAWLAEQNVQYSIFVQGRAARVGNFLLTISEESNSFVTECTTAIPIEVDGVSVVGSTEGSAFQAFGLCTGTDESDVKAASVWFRVQGSGSTMVASTCNRHSTSVARVEVYGEPCSLLSCVDDPIRSSCGNQMSFAWQSKQDVSYLIQVYGPGEFQLKVYNLPMNSLFTGASDLLFGKSISGYVSFVSDDDMGECTSENSVSSPGLWFRLPNNAQGQPMTLSICSRGTSVEGTVRLYACNDKCETLECIAVNDGSTCGVNSYLSFDPSPGRDYFAHVQGTGASDIGGMEIALGSANHICDSAELVEMPILSTSLIIRGSTQGATTTEADPPSCLEYGVSVMGPSIWYKIVGTGEQFRAKTCSDYTSFDTQISIFAGTDCENLKCVIANDNACGIQSEASWFAEVGIEYYIMVHGYESGDFELTLEVIENFSCDSATEILVLGSETPGRLPNSTSNATIVDPCSGNQTSLVSSWYSLVGPGGNLTLDACPKSSSRLQQISVVTANCEFPECVAFTQDSCNLTFDAIKNQDYLVYVTGDVGVDFELSSSIFNDVCESAIGPIERGDSIHGSTEMASFEDIEVAGACDGLSNRGTGVWYKYVGDGRPVTAFTCSDWTNFETQIYVYSSESGCSDLQCVVGRQNNCDTAAWATFPSVEGQLYFILIAGKGTSSGDFELLLL